MLRRIEQTILVVLLVVLSTSCFCRRQSDKQKSDVAGIIPLYQQGNTVNAYEARYLPSLYGDTMLIYVDDERFRMTPMGNVIDKSGSVYFSIKCEEPVASLYYMQRGRDFFVFYSSGGHNTTHSTVTRISLDTRKIVWTSKIEGETFSCPVIHGQFAYITTNGHIGKMILKNGLFDWHFNKLQRNGRFSRFSGIHILGGNKVQFISPQPFSFKNDTIIVNDITGEIIKMSL